MQTLIDGGLILLGYLLGSIPFGLIWVKLISGKDIRDVASGRTGGTNAARAAGPVAGVLTAISDGAKGACAAWIAIAVSPASHWIHVLAPLAAILGHNYSLFLIERRPDRSIRFRGGAGGGPTVGGAIGLWWPSALIVLPIAALVFFGIGYASVTTISIALTITGIFAVGYFMHMPWAASPDLIYGVLALVILLWALRPNLRALVEGRERFHGWRPWRETKRLFPGHAHNSKTPQARSRTARTSKKGRRAQSAKSTSPQRQP
jgi:glycerol-3-phosphate acyltransferase PlsY